MADGKADLNVPDVIYVEGPAGSGKMNLFQRVYHYVRMTGRIALCVAMSGIAALLLPRGRTAHSRFNLPVAVPLDGCRCDVRAQLFLAQLLRES